MDVTVNEIVFLLVGATLWAIGSLIGCMIMGIKVNFKTENAIKVNKLYNETRDLMQREGHKIVETRVDRENKAVFHDYDKEIICNGCIHSVPHDCIVCKIPKNGECDYWLYNDMY